MSGMENSNNKMLRFINDSADHKVRNKLSHLCKQSKQQNVLHLAVIHFGFGSLTPVPTASARIEMLWKLLRGRDCWWFPSFTWR